MMTIISMADGLRPPDRSVTRNSVRTIWGGINCINNQPMSIQLFLEKERVCIQHEQTAGVFRVSISCQQHVLHEN